MSLDDKYNRTVWIDVLNIVACIGVVLLHCSNNEIHNYDGILSSNYIWGSITHTLAFWPVPIFLMISGCNLIGKKYDLSIFYKKRLRTAWKYDIIYKSISTRICFAKER